MIFLLILWFIFMYLSVDYAIHFSGKLKINKRNKYQDIYFLICMVLQLWHSFYWYPHFVESEGWTNEETFAYNINDKNKLMSVAAFSNLTKLSTSCSFSHLCQC